MYRLRLLQTLKSDFSELRDYLGEAQFASLAQAFIACTPSRSHTLADYGPRFPDFLRDQARGSEGASKSHLLAMAELAELELEEGALWDQSPPATCASENWHHAMTDWSTLRFSLNSKVRILEFKHLPLSRVLPSRSVAGECASPSDSETDEPDGWCLLLARTSTGVQRRALSECARTLLLALGRGSDLVGAIALVPDLPEHPELIFSWFKQWISEGILEVH
jgi:hypothetical protein